MTLATKLLGSSNAADGTTVTTSNAGADLVTASGGSTITFATNKGPVGSQTGLKVVFGAGGTGVVRYLFAAGASNISAAWTFRIWTFETAPTANTTLFAVRQATPGRSFNVQWSATGAVSLYDAANTITVIAAAGVLSLNTQYVVSVVATGGTTTAGNVYIKFYTVGGSSPIASLHVTNANLTTSLFIGIDLGGTNPANTLGFSNLQYNDGSATEIPDYVITNANPIVSAGTSQSVQAGGLVNLTAVASDADHDSLNYSWTVIYSSTSAPVLTGSTTATPSFTATSTEGNLYILQCTVTDGKGGSASDTVEVQVPTGSDFSTMPGPSANGTWSLVGSAATSGEALADSNDSTLIRSPSYTSTESETRLRIQPLKSRTALQFTVRSLVSATGGFIKVRLYAGTTLKQEWALTQGTTVSDQVLTVSAGNLPSAGEWGVLYIAPVVSS